MSELVLSARLCLLTDWILFKDPGSATLNHQDNRIRSESCNMQSFTPHGCIVTDLHLFVLRHQAALQFLRVSKLFQQVQGQLLFQALLGQKHVLHRGREETQEAKE